MADDQPTDDNVQLNEHPSQEHNDAQHQPEGAHDQQQARVQTPDAAPGAGQDQMVDN